MLSRLLGRPVTPCPEGAVRHHDASGVHLLTTASLRRLAAMLPAPADPRRFRPNVLVDVPGEDLAEDAWCGRELALGAEVVLRLGAPMPRCRMVDLAQPDLPHDPRVLRALAAGHGTELGPTAEVVRPGVVREGDGARLL